MSARDALYSYLNSVRLLTGADTVSLCLVIDTLQQPPLLQHVGDMKPVAEMQSEQQILAFCVKALAQSQLVKPTDRPVFQLYPSCLQGGYLLGIDIQRVWGVLHPDTTSVQKNRRSIDAVSHTSSDVPEMLWLGLRYVQTSAAAEQQISNLTSFSGKLPQSSDEWLAWTLATGGQMAWQAHQLSLLQQDGITHLPGRIEFQACLDHEYKKAASDDYPLGLILLNPDEFGLINRRLGQEAGDLALRKIATRLSDHVRQSDQVFRYGGAIFVVVLPGASRTTINKVAENLRQILTEHNYIEGATNFSFSVGAAAYESAEDDNEMDSPVLLRRADQALNVAKLSGGARTVIWNPEGNEADAGNLDRLSGIFTADTEKDYRNMLLLWETITVISSWSETEAIAREFVERIGASFKPRQVGLLVNTDGQQDRLLATSCMQSARSERVSDRCELSLSAQQKSLITAAEQHKRTQHLSSSKADGQEIIAYAIPLLSSQKCLGCLYIDGTPETLTLDTSDLVFLDALASQIGVLLDRAVLASRWQAEKDRESQQLRDEVEALRQSIQRAHLIYQSSNMEAVVDVLSKVAPTDVTILIAGESGSGKGMLAQAVHELSAQKEASFVTVDCGAIAHSLIDTELFGRIKGAYTGAQNSAPGRIIQAKGGTLFLDEIGELPLETQIKLLRLIQEKEITPVGGSQPIKVDVRIIAATNRDLSTEVAEGRFRKDLYYRLQVVTVTAPPLRERTDDILLLAGYFLTQFVADYHKGKLSFDQSAEKALLGYSWPGNVRELQNRILQAVVMSDKPIIAEGDLRLPTALAAKPVAQQPVVETMPVSSAQESELVDGNEEPSDATVGAAWDRLREIIRSQLRAIQENSSAPVPLGKWLADDLVLAADKAANNIARRAAVVLGMPETTFRRRLEKVQRESEAGLVVRNADWFVVLSTLPQLIADNKQTGESDLFQQMQNMVLDEIVTHVQKNVALGSVLMGVTAPTYRRWVAVLKTSTESVVTI